MYIYSPIVVVSLPRYRKKPSPVWSSLETKRRIFADQLQWQRIMNGGCGRLPHSTIAQIVRFYILYISSVGGRLDWRDRHLSKYRKRLPFAQYTEGQCSITLPRRYKINKKKKRKPFAKIPAPLTWLNCLNMCIPRIILSSDCTCTLASPPLGGVCRQRI